MNWRRGVLRLWIVASIIWIGAVTWTAYTRYGDSKSEATRHGMFDDLIPLRGWIEMYAPVALGPPAGTALALILGGRIAAGFGRVKNR